MRPFRARSGKEEAQGKALVEASSPSTQDMTLVQRQGGFGALLSSEKEMAHARALAGTGDQGLMAQGLMRLQDADAMAALAESICEPGFILRLLSDGGLPGPAREPLLRNISKSNKAVMLEVLRQKEFVESRRIGFFYPKRREACIPPIFASHMDMMIAIGKEIGTFNSDGGAVVAHSMGPGRELRARTYEDVSGFSPGLVLMPLGDGPITLPRIGGYTIGLCYGFQLPTIRKQGLARGIGKIITENGICPDEG